MNAEEARKLTAECLAGPATEKYIAHIDNRILAAAKGGRSSVHNPQVGKAEQGFQFYLEEAEKKAVRVHYEKQGFDWVDYAGPARPTPTEGPYTMLRW